MSEEESGDGREKRYHLWGPFFREMMRFQEAMHKLFDEFSPGGYPLSLFSRDYRIPKTDLHDEEDNLIAILEVPGVKKEDIEVMVERERYLRVEAKSSIHSEEEKEGVKTLSREFRSYKRILPLPAPVLEDEIKASYNNGILTVTMPKAKKLEGKKVKVE